MEFRTNKDQKPEKVKAVTIFISDDRYRITESVDGKLTINKTSDGDSDSIRVYPRYSNEIEIN